jgi:ribosomal protein L21E
MDGDKTITATFTDEVQYNLTIAKYGNGTVTPGAGIHAYDEGSTVNLTATPAEGWQFASWAGEVANYKSATTSVTMDEDKSVTAYFFESGASYDLTIAVTGDGTVLPAAGSHSYAGGSVIEITATPASGWRFKGWTGEVADADAASTTITISRDAQISAIFEQIVQYRLTISASGSGTVTPSSGTHDYEKGADVSIKATPSSGWQFAKWTGNVADPKSATTSIVMDKDQSITAVFVQIAPEANNTNQTDGNRSNQTYFIAAIIGVVVLMIILIIFLLARSRG